MEIPWVILTIAIVGTVLFFVNRHFKNQALELQKAKEDLKVAFQALSGEALKSNNQAFMDLAKQTLNSVLKEAKGDIGQKEEAIKGLVKPLEESLKKYEQHIREIETKRSTAYGSLENQIRNMMESQKELQKETNNLVSALRKPAVKGSWGQITLRKVVELAGMTEYCDFQEEVSVKTDDGAQRPDMIVRLPSNREIVIDSKVSTGAYLEAVEAGTEEEKNALFKKHAQQIRAHMEKLARKSYWQQFEKSPEFVVMFLPGESFFSSASIQDFNLIEDGMKNKVVLATPTTLMALLKAVAYGWRQEQITRNALEIAKLGKELYERFQPFFAHSENMKNSLNRAVESYNRMVGSLNQRVLPTIKKFKDLGVESGRELEDLSMIEQVPLNPQLNGEKETIREKGNG
jgi:DNA recombination protein RmuC